MPRFSPVTSHANTLNPEFAVARGTRATVASLSDYRAPKRVLPSLESSRAQPLMRQSRRWVNTLGMLGLAVPLIFAAIAGYLLYVLLLPIAQSLALIGH